MRKRWFLITLTMVTIFVCVGCDTTKLIPKLTTKDLQDFIQATFRTLNILRLEAVLQENSGSLLINN